MMQGQNQQSDIPDMRFLQVGLSTISAQTINGAAQCVFSRPAAVIREISGGATSTFDLNKESYFLLAASGKTNGKILRIFTAWLISPRRHELEGFSDHFCRK